MPTPRSNDSNLDGYNYAIEEIRQSEYPLLKDQTYLDHAGTTLYAKSLIQSVADDLTQNTFGNPHSDHRPSKLSSTRVEAVRRKTLRFFNADPEHFDLIFVANASAAIKLVGDCFRDAEPKGGFWYGYHRDCHTSLVGLREATRGRHHCFTSDGEVDRWIANRETEGKLPQARNRRQRNQLGLFAYPGQSNMTGRRLPLSWPASIRESVFGKNTYTLLDATALATTAALDLSDHTKAPDFTCISFYKMFGYPDLGGLIVRKASSNILRSRRNFYGGTVDMVIALDDTWHAKKDTLHDRLEDGTLPFHSIIALGHAIDSHARIFGSMKAISAHTAVLTRRLHTDLSNLTHANGLQVCTFYNDASAVYGDPSTQGATIAFNIQDPNSSIIGYADVERLADKHGISVRSGSLCNPGGLATYLHWSAREMKAAWKSGHRCSDPTQIVNGKPTGVVRVSLGAMSSLRDVETFVDFVKSNYVDGGAGARAEGVVLACPARRQISTGQSDWETGAFAGDVKKVRVLKTRMAASKLFKILGLG